MSDLEFLLLQLLVLLFLLLVLLIHDTHRINGKGNGPINPINRKLSKYLDKLKKKISD